MKIALKVLAIVVGVYFIVRAIIEPFLVDASDPSTYMNDWGGPSLVGVLAVHMVPGIIAAALFVLWIIRTKRSNRPDGQSPHRSRR